MILSHSSSSSPRTVNERSALHKNIIAYLRKLIPRPKKDGLLYIHKEEEQRLAFYIKRHNDKTAALKKITAIYNEEELANDFKNLPFINIPRVKYAQLYVDNIVYFPEEDVQRIFLEINDIMLILPEVSCRDYMRQNNRYKKGSGVLCCCPKCGSNAFVEPVGFCQNTFLVYGIDRVYNAMAYKYKCKNANCRVRKVKPQQQLNRSSSTFTQKLSAGVNKISNLLKHYVAKNDYAFTSNDVASEFPTISILKRPKCSVTHELVRKCFDCNGPSMLVRDISSMYNNLQDARQLKMYNFMNKHKNKNNLDIKLDKFEDIQVRRFTLDISKKIFKETVEAFNDDIKAFFLSTPKTWSLHGDGTYKFTLSTSKGECVLYIITNSYRQILGWFVVKSESGQNLKAAFKLIDLKDKSIKIEAVFMDDIKLFKVLREVFHPVECKLDIFHVCNRILSRLRGDDCDADLVRSKLVEVFYGKFPDYKECVHLCDKYNTEEEIARVEPTAIGDVAQIMKSLLRRKLCDSYPDSYDKSKTTTYRDNIRRAPIGKIPMEENMKIFIDFLRRRHSVYKDQTNVSSRVIKVAENQLKYIQLGYCSPPEFWGHDKLFYKIGNRGVETHLQRWGKVFGTSGVEAINKSISGMAYGISNLNDDTAENRLAVNLYNQEYERRVLLNIPVPPRQFKYYFLYPHANKVSCDLYGKEVFNMPNIDAYKDIEMQFGYAYFKNQFHLKLSSLLSNKVNSNISIIDLLGKQNKNDMMMPSSNRNVSKKDNNVSKRNLNNQNGNKSNGTKKRKIKTVNEYEIGANNQQLNDDEIEIVHNAIAHAKMEVKLGRLEKSEIIAEAYRICGVKYFTEIRKSARERLNIRGFISDRAIESILAKKVKIGPGNNIEQFDIDKINDDDIRKLSKSKAKQYIDEINKVAPFAAKIVDVCTVEKLRKNNNSRRLCYIDGLLEYKHKKKM
eukprot:g4609.t1